MKVNKCGHKRTAKVFQFEDVLPVMIFATLLCKKSKRGIINRKQLLLSNFNFTIVTYRSQNSSGFLLHYNTYYGRTDTEDHSGDDNVRREKKDLDNRILLSDFNWASNKVKLDR